MEAAVQERQLDVITIGRASVDLYGQQIGSRLEDIASFAKSVGGCPCNIAVGTARLGLRSALITRVGREQMGRFIREQLAREGVETSGIVTDDERLTALVLLAVEDEGVSPMIFYRTDCADMALDEGDIDESFIASSRSIVITGTHLSRPHSEAAQLKAVRIARENDVRVIFDIDYRPNLWGLAGHDAGFSRYVKSSDVTDRIKPLLPDCDVIVGTEEEIMIAAGADDVADALHAIRAASAAVIVLKRGALGCIVYDGAIPADLEQGIVGQGFPIEVHNVLGAGDAFMSGFLRGWLTGEPHATSATWANACGAFAVSRLLCAPEYPSWAELTHFLAHGSSEHALRKDETLNHIHRSTTRARQWPSIATLAIDHRAEFEGAEQRPDRPVETFKLLAAQAAIRVADGRDGFGILADDRFGRKALFAASHAGLWIGRPVEVPGSRPLQFELTADIGSRLVEWPAGHCVKVLCLYHPDDSTTLKAIQIERLRIVEDAARRIGRDLLIEIVASRFGRYEDTTTARAMTELYASGLKPDWWKLEPQPSAAGWDAIDTAIFGNDPLCRGVMVLGLDMPMDRLTEELRLARHARWTRGFAVGRTIFGAAAKAWLSGAISDEEAIEDMASRFRVLVEAWNDK